MVGQETVRRIFHKTEVGLPRFSPEQREDVVGKAKAFVSEVKMVVPEAGIDRQTYHQWVPRITDFRRPRKIGANPHAYHNLSHVASIVGEEMFLLPYVDKIYKDNLTRALMENAVYAGAGGHDLERFFDVFGAFPDSLYKLHGRTMAEGVRSGKRYPQLTPLERSVAAQSIQYHDVDRRDPKIRNPEDDFLAIVDRADLGRLIYGVGFIPTIAQAVAKVTSSNVFEKRMLAYESHYFPGLMEKIQPLSQAMLILRTEGMKKGLSQEDAVVAAMQELGMIREASQEKSPKEKAA